MPADIHDATRAAFDPDRLTQARMVRGLKKVDLAALVGVTPAAIGQYEQGRTRPSSAVLAKASLALGFPMEFFAARHPKGSVSEGNAYFRRLRSTSARARSMQVARLALLDELVANLELRVDLPVLDLPMAEPTTGTRTEIEDIAQWVRETWRLGNGPLDSVVRLLEARGCVVARLASEAEGVDAYCWRAGPRPVIVLTRDKADSARSNFDAAHELGHLVMHPEPIPGSRDLEQQAQMFAAAFLMPASSITELLPTQFDVAAFIDLKRLWRVSVQALLYRARVLGRFSEPAYRRAMAKISVWGWRTNEPADFGPSDEPVLLSSAVKLLESELGIDTAQLARELALPPALIYSFITAATARPRVDL